MGRVLTGVYAARKIALPQTLVLLLGVSEVKTT